MKNLGSITDAKDIITKEFLEENAAPKSHEHPTYENTITSIKVNGVEQTVVDKAVDINVPTGNLAKKDIVSEDDLDDSIKTKIALNSVGIIKASVEVTDAANQVYDIPFTVFDKNTLSVYHNGLLLTEGTHYTATTTQITLDYSDIMVGDILTFISSVDGATEMSSTAEKITIADSANKFTSTNVEGALAELAEKTENAIENLNTNTESLDERMTSNEKAVSNLSKEVTAVKSKATANEQNISSLNSSVSSLQSSVSANETNIDTLNTNTEALTERVTANEANISSMLAKAASLEAALAAI